MRLKRCTVEGFKCYKDLMRLDPFSPRHNVIGAPCVALSASSMAVGPSSAARARAARAAPSNLEPT